ncbi:MAG: hypothetical protein GX580_08405 [Candidatus Hydrogenedens sp.]|nr:hypothetical protein [Candidatus Hydrogenedens sp.]
MTTKRNQTRPDALRAAERRHRAFALRLEGRTFRQIGDELGINGGTAHRDITRHMAEQRERFAELAADALTLELERLDSMLAAVWQSAMGGHLPAVDRVLKISERRARLLGLDRPAPVDGGPVVLTVKYPADWGQDEFEPGPPVGDE